MTLKSLTRTYVVELVLEKGGKQTVLTLFPNVIATLSIDMTIIDEELLILENYDFHYSRKRVVTNIVKHEHLD